MCGDIPIKKQDDYIKQYVILLITLFILFLITVLNSTLSVLQFTECHTWYKKIWHHKVCLASNKTDTATPLYIPAYYTAGSQQWSTPQAKLSTTRQCVASYLHVQNLSWEAYSYNNDQEIFCFYMKISLMECDTE